MNDLEQLEVVAHAALAIRREQELSVRQRTGVGVVGEASVVGRSWSTSASLVFIDGGHGPIPAHEDFDLWSPHVKLGGMLAIHDVFPDPADGGRPPYEIFCRALESGQFAERRTVGSLRILERVSW